MGFELELGFLMRLWTIIGPENSLVVHATEKQKPKLKLGSETVPKLEPRFFMWTQTTFSGKNSSIVLATTTQKKPKAQALIQHGTWAWAWVPHVLLS